MGAVHGRSVGARLGPLPSPIVRSAVIRLAVAASTVTLSLLSLAACSSDGRTLRPAGPNQTLSIITTTSAARTTTAAAARPSGFVVTAPWPDGGFIDAQ